MFFEHKTIDKLCFSNTKRTLSCVFRPQNDCAVRLPPWNLFSVENELSRCYFQWFIKIWSGFCHNRYNKNSKKHVSGWRGTNAEIWRSDPVVTVWQLHFTAGRNPETLAKHRTREPGRERKRNTVLYIAKYASTYTVQ